MRRCARLFEARTLEVDEDVNAAAAVATRANQISGGNGMTLLPVHITAGIIAIACAFVALSTGKGATLHRKSGMIFVYAMLVMSGSGALMAFLKFNRGNIMGGGLTFYLVTTALLTTRRRAENVA